VHSWRAASTLSNSWPTALTNVWILRSSGVLVCDTVSVVVELIPSGDIMHALWHACNTFSSDARKVYRKIPWKTLILKK
jgi:hypothetical protein